MKVEKLVTKKSDSFEIEEVCNIEAVCSKCNLRDACNKHQWQYVKVKGDSVGILSERGDKWIWVSTMDGDIRDGSFTFQSQQATVVAIIDTKCDIYRVPREGFVRTILEMVEE